MLQKRNKTPHQYYISKFKALIFNKLKVQQYYIMLFSIPSQCLMKQT